MNRVISLKFYRVCFNKEHTLLSETYSLIDGIFKDAGTSSDHNDSWRLDGPTLVRNVDNSTISVTSQKDVYVNQNGTSWGSSFYFEQPIAIEFDLIDVENVNYWFSDKTVNYNGTVAQSDIGHLKFEIKDNTVYKYINGELDSTLQRNYTAPLGIGFRVRGHMTFKNFVVYPLG